MKIIEVRRCKKFKGAWVAFEAPGGGRFGGGAGEVHVYGDDASTIERRIVLDGRGQYPQVAGLDA